MKIIYYKQGKLNHLKTARSLTSYYIKEYVERAVDKLSHYVQETQA